MKRKARVYLVLWMLSSIFVFSNICAISNANGGMFDHKGMALSVAGLSEDASADVGSRNSDYDLNWVKLSLFNKHDIDDNWNVVVSGDLGYLRWEPSDGTVGSYIDTFSIGAELVLYRRIYKELSFGAGIGLSTLSDSSGMPHLGNSGVYGTGTVRLKLGLPKNYGIEAALDHISDALQEDSGNNLYALKLYYMFD